MENEELQKLKLEQVESSENGDANPRYDLSKEELESANEKMKNISNKELRSIVRKGSIVTHDKTEKQYDELWNYFISNHADQYESYMGYGITDIERIGVNKFIDFMDWITTSDIDNWKKDMIKVIPCSNCHNEFTTFQLDLGLCEHCKDEFDISRFNEMCAANEMINPGSSSTSCIAFAYFPEFRELYRKSKSMTDRIEDCVIGDRLKDMQTFLLIKEIITNNDKQAKKEFMDFCGRKINPSHDLVLFSRYSKISRILSMRKKDKAICELKKLFNMSK